MPRPKIIVRPTPRDPVIFTLWTVNGVEATPGASGVIAAQFQRAPTRFALEAETGGVVASYAVQRATVSVRPAPGARVREIAIERRGAALVWTLDGAVLPGAEAPNGAGQPAPGLPPDFFGEYTGMYAVDDTGQYFPRLVIEW